VRPFIGGLLGIIGISVIGIIGVIIGVIIGYIIGVVMTGTDNIGIITCIICIV
jgi:hypothetical protein